VEADRKATGERLRVLRERAALSMRALAARSGVTAGMISFIERGRSSPSLTTLQKILSALGSDLASFFGQADGTQTGPVFRRESMRTASDAERCYTILFPRDARPRVEMLDEQLQPGRRRPPFETPDCDVAGCVLSGVLVLEIDGEPRREVRAGDAFYVRKGTPHRGYAAPGGPVRLVTVCAPPRY
jgi:transcriptional regulator with XRE-family HTH domain